MRVARSVALVMLVALLAGACGARLSPETRKEAANAVLNSGNGGGGTGGTSDGTGTTNTGTGTGTVGNNGALPGVGGGGSGGAAGSGGTSGAAGSGGAAAGGGGAAGAGGASAGCAGGATDTGMTANKIEIGNVSSTSGPVSGLFQGAVQGIQAWAAYENSQGGICGHTVHIDFADDSTNCANNQNNTEQLASKVFAFVGSFSLYDGCGAKYLAAHTNVPDVHVALQTEADAPPNHFDVETGHLGYATGMFEYYAKKFGSKVQNVGTLYANVGGAVPKQHAFVNAATKAGWKFTYSRGADATETDWTGDFVTMCQRKKVQIFFTGATNGNFAAKMVNDEKQAGCKNLINIIPIAYDQSFLQAVGNTSNIEGLLGWNEYALFFNNDEGSRIPELRLFQEWFAKVNPGRPMNLYALFAWASGRLFEQAFKKAGSKANRQSLMTQLRAVKTFNAGGIMAPFTPSDKQGGVKCYVLWQVHNGTFSRVDDPASDYRCDGQFLPTNG